MAARHCPQPLVSIHFRFNHSFHPCLHPRSSLGEGLDRADLFDHYSYCSMAAQHLPFPRLSKSTKVDRTTPLDVFVGTVRPSGLLTPLPLRGPLGLAHVGRWTLWPFCLQLGGKMALAILLRLGTIHARLHLATGAIFQVCGTFPFFPFALSHPLFDRAPAAGLFRPEENFFILPFL